ncbi:MAG: hypothetical protein KJ770_02725 [Actinobacteria bacterium]|nr:hypothetical protein [Actinomycetota bacterium]
MSNLLAVSGNYLYCYPLRQRSFINIHSDKLEEWSKKNYLQYLDELNKSEIIQRRNTYSVDRFSKSIKINWKFRNPGNAILDDGRSRTLLKIQLD